VPIATDAATSAIAADRYAVALGDEPLELATSWTTEVEFVFRGVTSGITFPTTVNTSTRLAVAIVVLVVFANEGAPIVVVRLHAAAVIKATASGPTTRAMQDRDWPLCPGLVGEVSFTSSWTRVPARFANDAA